MEIIPVEVLLAAYAQGIFPMAESRHDTAVSWFSAEKRGIIPLEKFKVSSNVARAVRNKRYRVTMNRNFRGVMEACASREETWINGTIIDSYTELHKAGFAHSIEIWDTGVLVGGCYGVALKKAFFGESMFKRAPDADKVALVHCHRWLQQNNFLLWDTQFYTEHLGKFGCEEIDAETYAALLERALL
jgi:leucyl/phenylalanyl-tRNA--protein transferase